MATRHDGDRGRPRRPHGHGWQDGSTLAFDGLRRGLRRLVPAPGPGAPLEWRHGIRTVDDAAALHQQLRPGARVVVVGAGFVGTEVAATAIELGCDGHVVDLFALPLVRQLGPRRRRRDPPSARGARGAVPPGPGRGGGRAARRPAPPSVVLDDGTWLAADVVVEAVGSVANIGWLEGNGLDLDERRRLRPDLHPLRDGGPVLDVVALGDVARFPVPMSGAVHRIEHWNMPTEIAAHAARSLLAGIAGDAAEAPPFFPVPTFWSDQ